MTNTMEIKKMKTGKTTTHSTLSKIVVYSLLILYLCWVLVPFAVIFVTSLTPSVELVKSMSFIWWPETPTVDAYKLIFKDYFGFNSNYLSLMKGFVNTLMLTIPTMLVNLFVSGLSAFAFAKLEFPFRDKLFIGIVAIMMIPTAVMTLPSFLYYDALGWSATALPIIIPGMFGSVGMVFFLRQFIALIPNSIIEAARIDGSNVLSIYLKIIIPLSIPAFVTQIIFSFVSGYNAYQGPLLYLTARPDLQPLQLVLSQLQAFFGDNKAVVCASCLIAMMPLILIYIASQKYFMENLSASGLKD